MRQTTQRPGVQELLAADARFANRNVAVILLREAVDPENHAKRLARIRQIGG